MLYYKKNPQVSGPIRSKLILFKGQSYFFRCFSYACFCKHSCTIILYAGLYPVFKMWLQNIPLSSCIQSFTCLSYYFTNNSQLCRKHPKFSFLWDSQILFYFNQPAPSKMSLVCFQFTSEKFRIFSNFYYHNSPTMNIFWSITFVCLIVLGLYPSVS